MLLFRSACLVKCFITNGNDCLMTFASELFHSFQAGEITIRAKERSQSDKGHAEISDVRCKLFFCTDESSTINQFYCRDWLQFPQKARIIRIENLPMALDSFKFVKYRETEKASFEGAAKRIGTKKKKKKEKKDRNVDSKVARLYTLSLLKRRRQAEWLITIVTGHRQASADHTPEILQNEALASDHPSEISLTRPLH